MGKSDPPESESLKAFKAAFEESNRAWDEHDLERTYGGLPNDFEYLPLESWPHARPLHGPAEIITWMEDFQESFPDAHTEILEFIEADERTMIVGFKVMGTGEGSGATAMMEIWQVWEMREAGDAPASQVEALGFAPYRVREFPNRQAALEAVGAEKATERRH